MVAFFNQGSFNADLFGNDRISMNSIAFVVDTSSNTPSYTETSINKHELIDIIDIFQLGQQHQL